MVTQDSIRELADERLLREECWVDSSDLERLIELIVRVARERPLLPIVAIKAHAAIFLADLGEL